MLTTSMRYNEFSGVLIIVNPEAGSDGMCTTKNVDDILFWDVEKKWSA